MVTRICQQCGTKFSTYPAWIRNGRGKHCSKKCGAIAQTGPARKEASHGYVLIKMPEHHRSNTWGFVYEHIVIAEKKLGRKLRRGEEVHHKNHIRSDNRPENLDVLESKSEHRKLHAVERIKEHGGDPDLHKICSHCKRLKLRTDFTTGSSHGKRALASTCNPCRAALYHQNKRRVNGNHD
jgi:hypothetical protein